MAQDDVVGNSNSRMREAMDELMKSEEGRQLADKLKGKLKELNDQFKGLSGDDKKKFAEEFRDKFTESFGDLKDSLKMKVGDDFSDDGSIPTQTNFAPQPNYVLFLVAIIIVVIVFG